jgi:hypothetical protein
MENWIEHHAGVPESMPIALEMFGVSGGWHVGSGSGRVRSRPARIG